MTLRKISALGRGLTGGGLLLLVTGLAFQMGWAKIAGLIVAVAGVLLLWTKLLRLQPWTSCVCVIWARRAN